MTYSYRRPTGGFEMRKPEFAGAAMGSFSEVAAGPLYLLPVLLRPLTDLS